MRFTLVLSAFLVSSLAFSAAIKAPHKTGLKMPKTWYTKAKFVKMPRMAAELPKVFDWRSSGLSAVENQGNCGSCWAFSIAATFQDVLKITENKAVDLSEQYLLSCNNLGYNCEEGGYFDAHDMYVAPGAVLSADYPYTATTGTCKEGLAYPYQEKAWSYIGNQNPTDGYKVPTDEELKTAIYLYGPISVAINATLQMQFHSGSGIFSACSTTTENDINHAVNLIGWNDEKGAWIMRNSWGSGWGDKGFAYIKYGCNMIGYAANFVEYSKPIEHK